MCHPQRCGGASNIFHGRERSQGPTGGSTNIKTCARSSCLGCGSEANPSLCHRHGPPSTLTPPNTFSGSSPQRENAQSCSGPEMGRQKGLSRSATNLLFFCHHLLNEQPYLPWNVLTDGDSCLLSPGHCLQLLFVDYCMELEVGRLWVGRMIGLRCTVPSLHFLAPSFALTFYCGNNKSCLRHQHFGFFLFFSFTRLFTLHSSLPPLTSSTTTLCSANR